MGASPFHLEKCGPSTAGCVSPTSEPQAAKPWVELTNNSTSPKLPPMRNIDTFGQRIRARRLELNLTQKEVAEKVAERVKEADRRGFDVTYLSKIENGRVPPPSTEAILELASVLDTNADELLAVAGKTSPDVGATLMKSASARAFFRSAADLGLSEAQWQELIRQIKEKA